MAGLSVDSLPLEKECKKKAYKITGRCEQGDYFATHKEGAGNHHQSKQCQKFSGSTNAGAIGFDQNTQHKADNQNPQGQQMNLNTVTFHSTHILS